MILDKIKRALNHGQDRKIPAAPAPKDSPSQFAIDRMLSAHRDKALTDCEAGRIADETKQAEKIAAAQTEQQTADAEYAQTIAAIDREIERRAR